MRGSVLVAVLVPALAAAALIEACAARPTPARVAELSALAATRPHAEGDAARGEKVFRANGCQACHSTDGTDGLGPTLKGYHGSQVQYADGSDAVADDAHVRAEIIDPMSRVMAGYAPTMPALDWEAGGRSFKDVDDLVAYIRTLK
jgi:cytochrome c2